MTNILRDLDEDAAMGRLYLPREALAEAGIAETDREVLADPALDRAAPLVAARARVISTQRGRDHGALPAQRVRSPRLMAAVYRPMLDR